MWVYGWGDLPGRLIVISGPSGTGKSTILNRLRLRTELNLHMSVSATTRPARPGEREGVDYYFLTRERFLHEVEGGDFLEHATYNGNLYGTPKRPVLEAMSAGHTVILEIELQGAMQVREQIPTALFIFINVPDFNTLEKRLRARGTEDELSLHNRLVRARRERDEAHRYDYQLMNNDPDEVVRDLVSLITLQDPER